MTDPADHGQRAPREVAKNLNALDAKTPFAKALAAFIRPGAGARAYESFFENRAASSTIACWRLGYRNPPQWAIDLIRQRVAAIETQLQKTKPANQAAGHVNILKWHARKKD